MDDLLGLLGLAKKAGKAALGEEETVSAALAHTARLIFLAADAAEGTAAKVRRAAGIGNGICFQSQLTKAELGGAVGRGSCAALALTDVGFAAAAAKKMAQSDPVYWGEISERLSHKAAKTIRRRRERRHPAKPAKPWAVPPPKSGEK